MKTLWTLLVAVELLFGFEYGLKPQSLGEGIYCFFGAPEAMNTTNNGNMVNTCYVDMGTGWLVVDSGPTYNYAKEAHAAMDAIKPMPVTHVVNTHVHDDHWLGNGYYLKHGATVLGSEGFEKTSTKEPTRMQSRISAEAYEGTHPALPNEYVATNRMIPSGKDEVIELRLLPTAAHTAGDMMLYLPQRRALFAGDLVFNDRIPSLRDGDINGWIAALEAIAGMELNIIVGGHGSRTDKKALNFTLEYLKALKAGVMAVIDEGGGIDDAVEQVTLQEYQGVAMYDALHKNNVNKAFRTLEWTDE